MLYAPLSADIIGAAMAVLNELKPGLDEKLYENALVLELQARGHVTEQQRVFRVQFRDRYIGRLIPDLIVDDLIIVETKVVSVLAPTHVAQLLGYLNITGLRVALLLNFKDASLRVKRISL